MRHFVIDRTLRESLTYQQNGFPIELCVDDYSVLPEHTLNCHWHYEFELDILIAGELDYYISGVHVHLREGDCVFINANTMHMAKQSIGCPDAKMFVVAFSSTLLAHDMNSVIYQKFFQPITGKPLSGFVIERNTAEGEQILSALSELYALQPTDFAYELFCISLVSRAWGFTLSYAIKNEPEILERKNSRQDEERVKSILFYIQKHFAEELSIASIAQHINISSSECFRCFKRFTHKTPGAYINEYRLSQAAKMLMETTRSITEIGLSCGFAHSSYFCKIFKQMYGLSPLQYRRSLG